MNAPRGGVPRRANECSSPQQGLFARRGYEGTSIGDVARQAQVGVNTVYHHFADKLLIHLLEGAMRTPIRSR